MDPIGKDSIVKLNTSNQGKLNEYKTLFKKHGVELVVTSVDVPEIEADHLTVTVHKASQFKEVIIEDTSLEIEDAKVGINIRWLINHLDQYIQRKATWTVYLAFRKKDLIYIYKGEVLGTIVEPKGTEGYGFDSFFQPDGAQKTLAEVKENRFNARALAVDAFMNNSPFAIIKAIDFWNGQWQKN